jgi:hypothetical protein
MDGAGVLYDSSYCGKLFMQLMGIGRHWMLHQQ